MPPRGTAAPQIHDARTNVRLDQGHTRPFANTARGSLFQDRLLELLVPQGNPGF